jgi:hypothetical protein
MALKYNPITGLLDVVLTADELDFTYGHMYTNTSVVVTVAAQNTWYDVGS